MKKALKIGYLSVRGLFLVFIIFGVVLQLVGCKPERPDKEENVPTVQPPPTEESKPDTTPSTKKSAFEVMHENASY